MCISSKEHNEKFLCSLLVVVVIFIFQEHLSTLRLWEQVLNTLNNKETREQSCSFFFFSKAFVIEEFF